MPSFIQDVLTDLEKKGTDLSEVTFILPSKRAGVFLKHEIAARAKSTFFSPIILSIETFVEELSQLKQIANTELLFEFYKTYLEVTPKDQVEGFDSFSKWAQILLQDFNEIDRYLIPAQNIFDYLKAIKDIDHWSFDKNQTPLIKNYLKFWERLPMYYTNLSYHLKAKGLGYQGLIYREAMDNLESYIQHYQGKQHIFLGFNALNTAESSIIQELLHNGMGHIYWDIDTLFVENQNHDTGYFLRQYRKHWRYFEQHPFNWMHNYYTLKKNISVTGTPKNIGQAKYIGALLQDLKSQNGNLNNTAIVLGDENLLIPVLTSLPDNIDALNITMGFPLRSIPLASLFDQLFILHRDTSSNFYYKDVISLLSHQFVRPLLLIDGIDYGEKIITTIQDNNLIYLSLNSITEIAPDITNVLSLLFSSWKNIPKIALDRCLKLILLIKEQLDTNKDQNVLALEYLFRFHEVFNVLEHLNAKYNYINSIKALQSLYYEVLSSESLDFQGEPLQGLQIMGMLESRVLDFDTVIIASVNEGILPAGKSNNSFIPYDVKIEHGLPTYKEKDAVYTYHFYKLIQRAKNVHIIYNTEPDVLNGGEKSRFITQMEVEGIHELNHSITTPKTPKIEHVVKHIKKTKDVLLRLKEVSQKGFSPSSLTNYVRNPIDFYYQKVLGIKEFNDVEETVAANTLGTVVHNTLEDLYKPLEGKLLDEAHITSMKRQIDATVQKHFTDIYKAGDITKGKNLIIFEIAKRYVSNFLNKELGALKEGNTIKIVQIEANLQTTVQFEELPFPITLTGKVDRVDEYNGTLRIIDYKTGKVEQSKVEVINWEDITTDYTKYSKSFQVLMYAYMLCQEQVFSIPVEAGIISFKNLNSGFLKFAKKDKPGAYAKKNTLISEETLQHFYQELKQLILEIFDPNIDFIEKEV